MHKFAHLLNALVLTPSRNRKLELLSDYFRTTPDPDRGLALAALTNALDFPHVKSQAFRNLVLQRIDPVLFALSYDYVGDLADTIALIWPKQEGERESGIASAGHNRPPSALPTLPEIVETLRRTPKAEVDGLMAEWLDAGDGTERWGLIKLITGNLRIGLSERLAKQALALLSDEVSVEQIEEIWHGLEPPYSGLFHWLKGKGPRPEPGSTLTFRPLMLSHPSDDVDKAVFRPEVFAAEWKWDGIRVQLVGDGTDWRLYSRTGDDITQAFPDLITSFVRHPRAGGDLKSPTQENADLAQDSRLRGNGGEEIFIPHATLDGELLVHREGEIASFNDLQQRLNRKQPTAKQMAQYPAHLRLYDMLFDGEEDLRPLTFMERRARLEAWLALHGPARMDLSPLVAFTDPAELGVIQAGARSGSVGAEIEGFMLKRKDAPYIAGRPKGYWYKWKRDPLSADVVLMYAQRGHGKRSSFYSDYTFGCWTDGPDGASMLVPVGKAYSGYTDEELTKLDRWIRNHTNERFGPVRGVEPGIVFEVGFDGLQLSGRHKSGVAMRFPRILRIRWDKPATEADSLDTLKALLPERR